MKTFYDKICFLRRECWGSHPSCDWSFVWHKEPSPNQKYFYPDILHVWFDVNIAVWQPYFHKHNGFTWCFELGEKGSSHARWLNRWDYFDDCFDWKWEWDWNCHCEKEDPTFNGSMAMPLPCGQGSTTFVRQLEIISSLPTGGMRIWPASQPLSCCPLGDLQEWGDNFSWYGARHDNPNAFNVSSAVKDWLIGLRQSLGENPPFYYRDIDKIKSFTGKIADVFLKEQNERIAKRIENDEAKEMGFADAWEYREHLKNTKRIADGGMRKRHRLALNSNSSTVMSMMAVPSLIKTQNKQQEAVNEWSDSQSRRRR